MPHVPNQDDLTIAQLKINLIPGLKADHIADCLGDDDLTFLTDFHSHTPMV